MALNEVRQEEPEDLPNYITGLARLLGQKQPVQQMSLAGRSDLPGEDDWSRVLLGTTVIEIYLLQEIFSRRSVRSDRRSPSTG